MPTTKTSAGNLPRLNAEKIVKNAYLVFPFHKYFVYTINPRTVFTGHLNPDVASGQATEVNVWRCVMFTVSAEPSAKRERIILNVKTSQTVNKRVVEENTFHPIFSRQFRTATGWSIAMPAHVLKVNKELIKRDIESCI